MSVSPRLPPLFTGERVPNQTDPFDKAVSRAIAGVDSGTIFYSDAVDVLRAALVLAPETSLEEAVQVVYVAQIGLAESLGGVESLIEHPTTMTHAAITPEERKRAGIEDTLIRVSVGIENIEDLKEDIDQALRA